MALPPGTTVGPYVIQEHIASGGMGEVYRARDPRLARDVAVKLLAGTGDPGSDLLRRFEQEARATAALSHQNILTVYDVQEAIREGIRRAEHQLELNPTDTRALSLGANALLLDGQRERALRWSERAMELSSDDQSVLLNGACLRARAGLREEALDLLERCFTRGWGKRDWVEHDPDFDSIRDDPRFQSLLAMLRQ